MTVQAPPPPAPLTGLPVFFFNFNFLKNMSFYPGIQACLARGYGLGRGLRLGKSCGPGPVS